MTSATKLLCLEAQQCIATKQLKRINFQIHDFKTVDYTTPKIKMQHTMCLELHYHAIQIIR